MLPGWRSLDPDVDFELEEVTRCPFCNAIMDGLFRQWDTGFAEWLQFSCKSVAYQWSRRIYQTRKCRRREEELNHAA